MEFYVHDNIENYNNRYKYNGFEKTRLDVSDIYIPETRAFWFKTNYNVVETNINLNKPYLHIHAGLTQFENMQFDLNPHIVKRTELYYNPLTKSVEVKIPKRFFRSEILFKKRAVYSGTKLPERPILIMGNIFYDMSKGYIHFILNYYPQKRGFKFHMDDKEEPATMEQKMKVEQLEDDIAKAERLIISSKS